MVTIGCFSRSPKESGRAGRVDSGWANGVCEFFIDMIELSPALIITDEEPSGALDCPVR
jgi:hypothetical protein